MRYIGSDWVYYGKSIKEFRAEGLHKAGVQVWEYGAAAPEVIGDINENGGCCNCCSSKASTVIERYRVLLIPGEMTGEAVIDGFRDGIPRHPLPFIPERRLTDEEWMAEWRQLRSQMSEEAAALDSEDQARIRCAEYQARYGTCHDCGVKAGENHVPGCDVERCPKCAGQLISCGCLEQSEE